MKLSLVCLALLGYLAYSEARTGIHGAIEHDQEMWRQEGYLEAVWRENGLRRTKRERDLIRERAKANYDKVVQELNDRFRNYKENCFPRPRGCVCVVRQDKNGRDITKRVLNDRDCKTDKPDKSRGVHDSRDRLRKGNKRKGSATPYLSRAKRFNDLPDGHSTGDGHDHFVSLSRSKRHDLPDGHSSDDGHDHFVSLSRSKRHDLPDGHSSDDGHDHKLKRAKRFHDHANHNDGRDHGAKANVLNELKDQFEDLREGCYLRPGNKCKCVTTNDAGEAETTNYDDLDDCKEGSSESNED